MHNGQHRVRLRSRVRAGVRHTWLAGSKLTCRKPRVTPTQVAGSVSRRNADRQNLVAASMAYRYTPSRDARAENIGNKTMDQSPR